MKWQIIKDFYECVLVLEYKIEYLGKDKFRIVKRDANEYWETKYLSSHNDYIWSGPYELGSD